MRDAVATARELSRAAQSGHVVALVALTFVLATAGCSGGGGGGAATVPPAPPTAVRAMAIEGTPDEVQLQWIAPAGAIDGYLVELKVGGGEFVPQNDLASLVPASWTGLQVTLASDAPDLVDYVVRMRSVRAAARSAYSNEAAYHRPLNAPRNVTARFDWVRLAPTVAWERRSTAATGASVQRVVVDANGFAQGAWTDLALDDPSAASFVDTTATRDTFYVYRVANVAGETLSVHTVAPAIVCAGLRPPLPFTLHFDVVEDAVSLALSGVTPDADGLRVERQALDGSWHPIGPWETIDVPAGVPTRILDRTWPERTKLAYRVSNLRGTYSSQPATFDRTVDTPLYMPADLAAVSADGIVALSWRNRSLVATQLGVYWSPQTGESGVRSVLGTLPATATTYDATGLGLGYYKLWASAELPGSPAASAVLDFTTPNPAGALSLVTRELAGSDAVDAVALPGGGWAFLARTPSLSVSSPGDPWPAVQRGDAHPSYTPVLAADADGRPHVVYVAVAPDGGNPVLTHLWYDGAAWRSEAMLRGPIATGYSTSGVHAALDATGNPQAIVVLQAGTDAFTVVYVRKTGAAWGSETVAVAGDHPARPSFHPAFQRLLAFGVDTAGAPHFVADKIEYARDAAGAWSTSPITPIGGFYDSRYVQAAAWTDAGNAVVLVHGTGSSSSTYELGVVEKADGAWQPVRTLASDRRAYFAPTFEFAATPDGSRVAILHGTEVGVRAYHRDAGTWNATLVAPPTSGDWLRIGFDAADRVRLLLRTAGSGGAPFVESREP